VDLEVETKKVREDAAREFGVAPEIHADDMLWRFLLHHPAYPTAEAATRHYFANGAESARKLEMIIDEHLPVLASSHRVSLLEFASGYGMVTRHLANVPSLAKLVACDIHPEAVEFIHDRLRQPALVSRHVPEELIFDESFDVVFALSFFSHMPEASFARWLSTLFSAVRLGGVMVFTTHGLISKALFGDLAIGENGFLFKPSSEQADLDPTEYGSSLATPAYVASQLARLPGSSLAEFRRGYWWQHQDLYIVTRVAST